MGSPARRITKAAEEVGRPIRTAMELLCQGFAYAEDLAISEWDFAVEIECLRDANVTNSDLRWLICKGYVEHAEEITFSVEEGRRFRPSGQLFLSDATCFVATKDGIQFATQYGFASPTFENGEDDPSEPNGESSTPQAIWDAVRRELRLGGKVVKRFRVPAPNQEVILSAFHEEGWPERIDDPLPPVAGQDVKQRLHSAIHCLNRNQKNRLMRFRGDGNGNGVCWEIASASPNGAK